MNEKFSDAGFTNSFLDIELSYFREVLNVNLISLFSVNREFIRNNSSGVIVNISSIYGVVALMATYLIQVRKISNCEILGVVAIKIN